MSRGFKPIPDEEGTEIPIADDEPVSLAESFKPIPDEEGTERLKPPGTVRYEWGRPIRRTTCSP
jgi:hypothetical protein